MKAQEIPSLLVADSQLQEDGIGLRGPSPTHAADSYHVSHLFVGREMPAQQLLLKFSQQLLHVFTAELCRGSITMFWD